MKKFFNTNKSVFNSKKIEDILINNTSNQEISEIEKTFLEICVKSENILGLRPHIKQIETSFLLYSGHSVDLPTGEGKTLSLGIAAIASVLLKSKKTFVCSSNETLSNRDHNSLKPLFDAFNLTSGILKGKEDLSLDITYSSYTSLASAILELEENPFLLSKLIADGSSIVFLDEIDTIVIDQGVNPITMSKTKQTNEEQYFIFKEINSLLDDGDFAIDDKSNNVYFKDIATSKIKKELNIDIYDFSKISFLSDLSVFIKANRYLTKDVHYSVSDNKVLVIDPITGFIKENQEFTAGLQQALQYKEDVPFTDESFVRNSITIKRCLSMFSQAVGCSGTAKIAEEEISVATGSFVSVVKRFYPKNIQENSLKTYVSKKIMNNILLNQIFEIQKTDSPILVIFQNNKDAYSFYEENFSDNTNSYIATGENIFKDNDSFSVAGNRNKITIATSGSGRGVDIKLSPDVKSKNGLVLFTVGLFESKRGFSQANGRVGRHGEKGTIYNFQSIEDEVVVTFGGSSLEKLYKLIDEDIHTEVVSKSFEKVFLSAQKESDTNKRELLENIFKYDELTGLQRKAFLSTRNSILSDKDFKLIWLSSMINSFESKLISLNPEFEFDLENDGKIGSLLNSSIGISIFDESSEKFLGFEKIVFDKINTLTSIDSLKQPVFETALFLMDGLWDKHFETLQDLKEGIGLRALNGKDPFSEYKRDSYYLYENFSASISLNLCENILGVGYSSILKMKQKTA